MNEIRHQQTFNDPKLDSFGKSTRNCKIYHHCMFIVAKQSYLATKAEIEKAQKVFVNEKLKWNNFEYLKSYEKKYGPRFQGLYEAVMKLLNEYRDVFATHDL